MKKRYTVILKVPGKWNDIYVADIHYAPEPEEGTYAVHLKIVDLAKAELREADSGVRMDRVRVLLTLAGKTEIMLFGWQAGAQGRGKRPA